MNIIFKRLFLCLKWLHTSPQQCFLMMTPSNSRQSPFNINDGHTSSQRNNACSVLGNWHKSWHQFIVLQRLETPLSGIQVIQSLYTSRVCSILNKSNGFTFSVFNSICNVEISYDNIIGFQIQLNFSHKLFQNDFYRCWSTRLSLFFLSFLSLSFSLFFLFFFLLPSLAPSLPPSLPSSLPSFLPFSRFYLFTSRERGREGEREREEHQCVVAFPAPPTGDLARNPGMYPHWDLNQWPPGLQDGTQSTESHQPGQS